MPSRPALLALLACLSAAQANPESRHELAASIDIAEVVSDFRVGFALLTAGDTQYAAYYDKERRMTVASRKLDSQQWAYQVLPSQVGWDSHNYITMAMDSTGCLHVSGNMHADPLVYFRTEKPGDITSLKAFPMTGKQEGRATYPKFLADPSGSLLYNYRDGGSGRGNHIYNKYDPATRTWSRFLDKPLFDGETERSSYPSGPILGPDGFYHMIWVWRDTPDCATNNHLSYARSKDLIRWESAFGEAIPLPIVLSEKQAWVDPIPSGGGIINGGASLLLRPGKAPLISYHKSDADGNMQLWVARPEKGKWGIHRLTDWDTPVQFGGNGSMGFIGISCSGLEEAGRGLLTMTYRHRDHGSGRLVIDGKSLKPLDRKLSIVPDFPQSLSATQSDFKGMSIRRASDSGKSPDPAVRYMLQWESLGANRDRKPPEPLPQPVMLRLHKLTLRQ
ncbi:BNR-4 repeat-containing protein [Akkermansiaceae bacterium]|nr:BNR-4 repeat-containing protein [Akkermansiaceae bacterium]